MIYIQAGNGCKELALFEYTGVNQLGSDKSATPEWARCSPGAQHCPLPSIREMTMVQGRVGPARGAAGQLFLGKRLVVPTRSYSAFCLFCCRRPRSGGFLLDATRCRVWICRVRPLGSHCPCLPGLLGCTRRRAAIAASKWGWGWRAAPRPVAGCWAVPADPSEPTAKKARDCGFSADRPLSCGSPLPRKLPSPGLLMGVFTFQSEEAEHPGRLETSCGWVC